MTGDYVKPEPAFEKGFSQKQGRTEHSAFYRPASYRIKFSGTAGR